MVKLVFYIRGLTSGRTNLFSSDLEILNTSHFPMHFQWFQDISCLIFMAWHQVLVIPKHGTSLWLDGFCSFSFLSFWEFWHFFPLSVVASTQRPWSDAQDVIQLDKRKCILLIRSLRNFRYQDNQKSMGFRTGAQVSTGTPGKDEIAIWNLQGNHKCGALLHL